MAGSPGSVRGRPGNRIQGIGLSPTTQRGSVINATQGKKMSQFDYKNPPVGGRKTRIVDAHGTLRMIYGWLGIKKGLPVQIQLKGGGKFQAYPIQKLMPDWSAILYGCTDVTGEYWAHLNDGEPCWNWLEMDGPMTAEEGSPYLERLSAYRKSGAPLNGASQMGVHRPANARHVGPAFWPEPYRDAWFKED